MGTKTPLSCPVCRARFRGTETCSRCGADLGPIMRLAARAWRERRLAGACMRHGELDRARRHVLRAQELCATPEGRRLGLIVGWMSEVFEEALEGPPRRTGPDGGDGG